MLIQTKLKALQNKGFSLNQVLKNVKIVNSVILKITNNMINSVILFLSLEDTDLEESKENLKTAFKVVPFFVVALCTFLFLLGA